ncbi:Hypothetical protein, putative [Bodo saltans]|uniref:SET domain-containing protein n=1 Tax=Bodo saltans TaxID=75058 RepID=A0A0S4JDK7_BODSA|nr:Hypothetical protein, putative [Bodo saltans]|eukprot:CUG88536.1 Hypothetical protein, putative [Bodo saltans]
MSSSFQESSSSLTEWFDRLLRQSHIAAQGEGSNARRQHQGAPIKSLAEFPVKVDVFPCGAGTVRGLKATKNIMKGEVIISVPYSCFVTAESILTLHAPQLEQDIRDIERRLEDAGVENPVTKPLPLASTILHSCESIITLFLLLHRYAQKDQSIVPAFPLSSTFQPYIESLPSLLSTSTPEFLLLLECDSCPLAYIEGDLVVQHYREQHKDRLYSRDELVVLLGSRVRLAKLTRRVERLFLRFTAFRSIYLSHSNDGTATSLQLAGSHFTFPQWLWASHMINSRTFMYRRPSWSNYPKRYEDGYDEASSEDNEDDEDDGDDDAILSAIETAKAQSRKDREAGVIVKDESPSSRLDFVQRRASAVVADEEANRHQKIGRGDEGEEEDNSSSDDDDTSSSDDDDAEDEPDLLTMVPFVDLFNHDNAQGTTDFSFDKKSCSLTIKADRPIFEGDQICLRYNNMDHWRFAKYYGFVPDSSVVGGGENSTSNETTSLPTATDAIPIAVPLPPTVASSSRQQSIVAVTKSQLFEGPALKKHCYVTKRGPNQQLQSVLRLAFLGAEDLERYTAAYEKPPLSIRNDWHVYEYLKNELTMRKLEVERNVKKHSKALPQGLTCRGLTATAVRSRDLAVARDALHEAKKRFEDLCGLLYFGSSTTETLRTHIIHDQFRELKAMGRLPISEEEQKRAGLGLLPTLVPGARFSVPEYTDALFQRLQKKLERAQRPSLPSFVDPNDKQ